MNKIIIAALLSIISFGLSAEPVNVNSASAEEIAAALKGVGMSKANAIVEHRESNGDFTSVEQLLDVKGIGMKTLEGLRTDVLLSDDANATQ